MPDARAVALSLLLLAAACADAGGAEERTVVASFYPLAYAAERIAGPGTEVVDVAPPGADAHDVELPLEQRAAFERADLILYLGDLGFQPHVEQAVDDANGVVVAAAEGLELQEGQADAHAEDEGLEEQAHDDGQRDAHDETLDPHVWLDPVAYRDMVGRVAEGFATMDPAGAEAYREAARELADELDELDRRYRQALADCATRTMVVSHEAFGYLADRYDLRQFGLAGISPEGEPTAGRLREVDQLIRSGDTAAIFYDTGAETQRVAETLAADLGVAALPLSTLETLPARGDYLTVMEANLRALQEGLECR